MINNEFPPLGGGQGVVNERLLAEYEREFELQIDLITASRSSNEWGSVKFSKNTEIHYVPISNKNIHHSSAIELLRFFWRGLGRAKGLCNQFHYDLSMAFSAVPAGGISWWLKRKHKIPYVTRSPGVDIPGFEARYRLLYPILKPIISSIWRNAETNIVSSQMHKELLLKVEPRAKCNVLYNAVDAKLFAPGSDKSVVRVLCVARLVKRKGVDILIRAFGLAAKEHPNAELVLVGTGDDEENLQQLAKDIGIQARVKFLGFVGRETMPECYKDASIFVLPSHNEGMSNAALEALASGLPIIITNVGGATEIVEDKINGFIIPIGDVQALSARLSDLFVAPAKLAAMGQASRKRAELFSWGAISRQYLELIKTCAIKSGKETV